MAIGQIALIANPAAQNGRGSWAAVEAASHLRARVGADGFRLLLTERPWRRGWGRRWPPSSPWAATAS